MNHEHDADTLIASAIDTIISRLDKTFPKVGGKSGWDFWRNASGEWVFEERANDTHFSDVSLHSLLKRALELPAPLPVYPRRPPNPPAVEPVRVSGGKGKWTLSGYGGFYVTKKAATIGGEFWQHQARKDQEAWDKAIAPLVYGKVEGVDFAWKD